MGAGAQEVLRLLAAGPALLGGGRLLAVDGPSGSGKTTLAESVAALAARSPGLAPVRLVHTDELLDGWDGLPGLGERLDPLLVPLAGGQPGRYRRYDWHAGHYAEDVVVEPAPLLVLEGVGAGQRRHAALVTTLVWMDAPEDLRISRGLARDGAGAAPYLARWRVAERAHFAADRTRLRADLVIAHAEDVAEQER